MVRDGWTADVGVMGALVPLVAMGLWEYGGACGVRVARLHSVGLAIAGGSNSVVESRLPKPLVAGSNPVSRSLVGAVL